MASTRDKREKRKAKYTSAKDWSAKQATGERTAVKLPEGIKVYEPKAGACKVDILPYVVGEGNPNAEPDMMHFERTYFIHNGIGPNNKVYICAAQTWGKKCAVCEHRARLEQDPDVNKDLTKALYWKKRQLFLVLDTADTKAGPQLWDIAYGNFGKQLKLALDLGEGRNEGFFRLDEEGRTLRLGIVEESFGGRKYLKVATVEFKKRLAELDESILDGLPCLDELLIPVKYDKVKEMLHQTGVDEDDAPLDDERPSRKSRHDDEDEDDEDDDTEVEDEDDEPRRPTHQEGKKKTRRPDPDEDDEDDEPAPKAKKKAKPVEGDEESEDDDDEPPVRSKKKKKPADEDEEDEDVPFDDDDDE